MRIAVCVKQVPDSGTVSLDPETHTLVRASVGVSLNPLDEFPLEIALRLKDATGAELVVFTMGPPRAEEVLARAMAMGADKAVLLSDVKFAGGDTWATSTALAEALKKFGPFDVALFGKQAIDGDTAQVGPETAAHLNWPQAACVCDVAMPKTASPKALRVKRLFEDFIDESDIPLPCVLTVLKEAAEPRFGTLDGRLNYFKDGVTKCTATDLGAAPERLGLKGSPTRVVKTTVPNSSRQLKVLDGTLEHKCSELAKTLREKIKD